MYTNTNNIQNQKNKNNDKRIEFGLKLDQE